MSTPLNVLILEDSESDAKLILHELRAAGYAPQARRVDTQEDFLAALTPEIDLILADYRLPDWTGADAIGEVKRSGFDIPLIIVSGTIGEENAAAVMKQGASDYLLKDRLVRLGPTVGHALEERRLRHERVAMAEALARAEARYRSIFERAREGILQTTPAGGILAANPALARLLGYDSVEQFLREVPSFIACHADEARREKMQQRLAATGFVEGFELPLRRRDGAVIWVSVNLQLVVEREGEPRYEGTLEDISERKRAEEALRQSEERYRLLFENNPLPMWVYESASLRFLAVNESTVQHYGFSRVEFLGMTIKEIRPAEDIPALLKLVTGDRSAARGSSEWRHRRKDGSIIHVEVISRPIVFNGHAGRLVVTSDITEKKLLEQRFLQAQRLESIGMLAAGIAHDLNNVLAPIVFAAPMLRDSLSDPGDRKILDTLELSAARGAGLVKQILGFAHSTTGEFRPTQVKHLARDIVHVIDETFPKSIRFEHDISTHLRPVLGNATQIHQVLLNLCVNARDAMPDGGTLRITAANTWLDAAAADAIAGARPGDWVAIEVSDTGTGIAPEVVDKIWEPFFTTKVEGKGTGLGLSTVRGIVAQHHGFVELSTTVGLGTTFRVFLPVVESEAERNVSASPFDLPPCHGELVLVVDDDPSIREIVAAILGRHGYRVVTCSDGVEGFKVFDERNGEFAVVVTDVDMPRRGGLALARAILQLRPEMRVLAMSGLSRNETGKSDLPELRSVAHAFLQKPFSPEVLLRAVHELLQPAGVPETPRVATPESGQPHATS